MKRDDCEFYHVGERDSACEYHPTWDYAPEEEPDEGIVKVIEEFFLPLYRTAKQLGLGKPVIYFFDPGEEEIVGKCVRELPNNVAILLLHTRSHLDCPAEEVAITLLHELGHLYIESCAVYDVFLETEQEERIVEEFARDYLHDAEAAVEKLISFCP